MSHKQIKDGCLTNTKNELFPLYDEPKNIFNKLNTAWKYRFLFVDNASPSAASQFGTVSSPHSIEQALVCNVCVI